MAEGEVQTDGAEVRSTRSLRNLTFSSSMRSGVILHEGMASQGGDRCREKAGRLTELPCTLSLL